MTIDHIAEALKRLQTANQRENNSDELGGLVQAVIGLTHATLATRGEPAGHPVTPYREALAELREGVEALLDALDGGADSYCRGHRDYLRGLLGRPS